MDIQSRLDNHVNVLTISGRFDNYTAAPARQWLETAAATPPAWLVVNLSQVHFLDSTALSTLVHALKLAREHGGDLRVCGLQQPVRMIFEMTRLDQVFEIYVLEDDAIHAYSPEPRAEVAVKDRGQPDVSHHA